MRLSILPILLHLNHPWAHQLFKLSKCTDESGLGKVCEETSLLSVRPALGVNELELSIFLQVLSSLQGWHLKDDYF